MARNYRPQNNWLTGAADPKHVVDARKGSRHKARKREGFVAWDGESITDDSGHRYTMLVSSNGDTLINPSEISTVQALNVLLDGGMRAPNKHHVGFAFSYDVNMILRDLSDSRLSDLWNLGKVYWRGYSIHYKPRKEFAIFKDDKKVRIWDVWGFFQSSFVNALDAYGHTEFLDFIAEMKERRATFGMEQLEEILRYCKMECDKLAEMMEQFAGYLQDCDLRLSRYDGAGAVASAFLKRYGVAKHMRVTEPDIQKAAAHAYFGGRIEMVQYGATKQKIYQYDLRSAYPAQIQHLPCLACGAWHNDAGNDNKLSADVFTCYRIRYNFASDSHVCPFPYRSVYGAVYFPRAGEGWYWHPEVQAGFDAIDAGIVAGEIEILERWKYIPMCDHEPFAWVPEMYEQRAAWKAQGIGAEKVLKLGLNSLYGKSAQRVGWKKDEPPTWHQLEWAGYVTSATRAALYHASFPAIEKRALIAYATDAVFSTIPLPELDTSEKLGALELDIHDGGTFVQSGVYWLGNGRVGHTRGFSREDITPEKVVAAWQRGEGKLPCEITRFVGMGRALTGPRQRIKWRTWAPETRTLSLTPTGTKRILNGALRAAPHKRLIQTAPADPYLGKAPDFSVPIKLPWLAIARAFDADAARQELRIDDESDSAHE